jgi:tRNA(fMet)-specific endonuclease VapC
LTLAYLLDTNVVSSPISKQPDQGIVERLERDGSACAIAAVTWHELVHGVRRLPKGKRRQALEAYLDDVVRAAFPVLPYDEAAASWHGEERARLEAKGRRAPFVYGQIAAIAVVNRLTLVTLNVADFKGFKELPVEDWARRSRT